MHYHLALTCDRNHRLIDMVRDADRIYHGTELYAVTESSLCYLHVVRGESRCHQWLRIYIPGTEWLGRSYKFYMDSFINRPLHLK